MSTYEIENLFTEVDKLKQSLSSLERQLKSLDEKLDRHINEIGAPCKMKTQKPK